LERKDLAFRLVLILIGIFVLLHSIGIIGILSPEQMTGFVLDTGILFILIIIYAAAILAIIIFFANAVYKAVKKTRASESINTVVNPVLSIAAEQLLALPKRVYILLSAAALTILLTIIFLQTGIFPCQKIIGSTVIRIECPTFSQGIFLMAACILFVWAIWPKDLGVIKGEKNE
jgi:hypothetical protein